jgi:hypothetical protein
MSKPISLSWSRASPPNVAPRPSHSRAAAFAPTIPRGMPTRRDNAMSTQSILDLTDVAIVAAFVSAMLVFIIYMWRSSRPSSHHRDRLS